MDVDNIFDQVSRKRRRNAIKNEFGKRTGETEIQKAIMKLP